MVFGDHRVGGVPVVMQVLQAVAANPLQRRIRRDKLTYLGYQSCAASRVLQKRCGRCRGASSNAAWRSEARASCWPPSCRTDRFTAMTCSR